MSAMPAYRHPLAPRAKEPTPEEAKQRREEMFSLNQSIRQALAEGRAALWKLAALLDVFDDEVGWSALGYESQNHWLGDPEIGLSRATFHRLVDTYRFLAKNEIPSTTIKQLEVSKIHVALPAVRQGRANLDDVIDDVQQLGYRDLREKYRDPAAKHEPDPPKKPPLPPDGEPTQTSDVEGGIGADTSADEGEPPIPVTDYDQPLEDSTRQGQPVGKAEPEITPSPTFGVVTPERLGKAMHTLEQIDLGLNAVSDAMRINALRTAREQLLSDYPGLVPEGAA